ncbi:hypothetical protein OOU_Y34scaffold00608g37 [Pyricularia oryzae Y34]|uniref:Uncharacterized protein n=2 Tax=Pyricularia oryzae TaxID=318829 RepID=A0AA97NVV2_PYRO3|nr:hypothetical protein OOU_Y34scaffold00608g37 [Pyricularia oryzae Y34]
MKRADYKNSPSNVSNQQTQLVVASSMRS